MCGHLETRDRDGGTEKREVSEKEEKRMGPTGRWEKGHRSLAVRRKGRWDRERGLEGKDRAR